MGFAGFLRKLQDIYTKHKLISSIFFCLLVVPPSFFYSWYATDYLYDLFVTNNVEDTNNLIGTTLHYIKFIAQVEAFAVLGISMFFLLSPLLQILVSHKIDPEAELSFKSLMLILTKSSRSLLFTWFSLRLFKLGYIFLGILLMFVFHEEYSKLRLCTLPNGGTIILASGGVVLFAYLAIYGNLALEVSAREGISGINALRKASELIEGKRKVIAFFMNLVLGVVSLGLFLKYEYLNTCSKSKGAVDKFVMGNLWLGISQVEFYTWTSFSILYSSCKKSRGETIFQPQGSLKRIMVEEEMPLFSSGAQMK